MRFKRVFAVLLLLLIIYVFIQIKLWRSLSLASYVHEKVEHVSVNHQSMYESVREVSEIFHHHGLWIHVIDPPTLHAVLSASHASANHNTTVQHASVQSRDSCRFICAARELPIFAMSCIQNQFQPKQDAILSSLLIAEYKVTCMTKHNSTRLITHCLLKRGGLMLHIVLVELVAPAGYWLVQSVYDGNAYELGLSDYGQLMMYAVTDGEHQLNKLPPLTFGHRHITAYDIPELLSVELDGLSVRMPRYPQPFLSQLLDAKPFIPCNHSRAATFTARNPPAQDERSKVKATLFRKRVRQLLSVTKHTLDQLGVPFWLSSGTCLGWYRQCDVITYSADVDIGIWIVDYTQYIIPAMRDAGLQLRFSFGEVSDSYELSFQSGDIKLDMFFFYEEADHVWNGGTQVKTGNKYKYIFPKFDLCWTEFLDLKVRVPCETESYITANYGPDWFIPVQQWDWKRSPPNVRPNGRWPEQQWEQVIRVYG